MTTVGAEARAIPGKRGTRRTFWLDIGALVLLCLLVIVALSVGRYPMTPGDVLAVVWMRLTGAAASVPASAETVLFQVRAPRIVAAAVIGAALAAAGAAYQGMFRNPLVSPDILGVSAGAGLGAVLGDLPVAARWWPSRASPSRAASARWPRCTGRRLVGAGPRSRSWRWCWRGSSSATLLGAGIVAAQGASPIPTTSSPRSPSGCSAASRR